METNKKRSTQPRPAAGPALPPWGASIRAWLEERGLSQAELARDAGLDPGTVGHIVRGGHCTTETLAKIARALEIELADLFAAPGEIKSLADRRDRLVVTVLRELSEDAANAVIHAIARRRQDRVRARLDAARRLPFNED
jgi:transcriptional regulator with XRE-family HTH domain